MATRYFRSNTSRCSILSEGASKTGKSSVAILKIAECPRSDFLKWPEQCNLYAACLASFSTTSCRGGRPRRVSIAAVGVVLVQPVIRKQVSRWMCPYCFVQWSGVFFSTKLMRHKSTSVLLPNCISNTPPSVSEPMFFLLPYGIARKLYWPSVLLFCYRYETSNSDCYLE
jgi:hypothetical protein